MYHKGLAQSQKLDDNPVGSFLIDDSTFFLVRKDDSEVRRKNTEHEP